MKKLEELGEGDVLFLAGSIPSSMQMTCMNRSWQGGWKRCDDCS